MQLGFEQGGREDYIRWQETDKKILKKINALIKECRRTPFEGTGQPEQLRHELSGYWSRRITLEHRLVYRVEGDVVIVAQCRNHY